MRGSTQQRAGDGDALPLAAGEGDAPLAHLSVVALRQRHDEIVGLGRFGRRNHLFLAGIGPAVGDVLANRGGKEQRVLQHDADVLAQDSSVT